MSRQGLEIFYLVRFHIFDPYQSSKNKIWTIEKQWKIVKTNENQWTKYEKYNKNNETYGKKKNGRLPNT